MFHGRQPGAERSMTAWHTEEKEASRKPAVNEKTSTTNPTRPREPKRRTRGKRFLGEASVQSFNMIRQRRQRRGGGKKWNE